ncbi:LacI family DNA-binding transcriptional regulator [Actinacidiphila oryziradicis]|jgi:LacI family transcriptional regulator|uniref:LacI family transcriptional regulator n=1 Tax=Actinacidiphila oryziradicis TaxID=2571141 RepID=A0A4U0ST24_9ACTN|nr:LacI family DNA-binding transcriptional regulator [Actinacidiphila oryziradicis]MCW2873496.1 LacI family transcriptional regulator [Actinacidiphila oryziradicis]TKA13374.1 LacI family transcriptional regulator [Actinacidiphila oryziradicis]
MAVTLADVAARAGVSAATVSRVLNGNYPVAGSTRERVLRAVDDLDYVVNGHARALAAATSDLVGVLVNDVADPFFGLISSAVQSEISGAGEAPGAGGGKLAVVCNTGGSPEAELNYLTLLERQRAAGVVLTGGAVEGTGHTHAVAGRLARLAASGTRIVLCGRPPLKALPGVDDSLIMTVAFDNRGGAQRLTEHLLSLGHRRIGYVAGPAERTTTRHRLEGHRAALAAAGLDSGAEHLTVYGYYDRSSGYDAALELLRRDPRLTAVVAANDTVALGVCAALRDQGLSVPGDVSVAGFDDLPFSVDAVPALTTVRIPLQEAGARAGRLVMGRQAPPPGGVATIRTELMARASTAAPAPGRLG